MVHENPFKFRRRKELTSNSYSLEQSILFGINIAIFRFITTFKLYDKVKKVCAKEINAFFILISKLYLFSKHSKSLLKMVVLFLFIFVAQNLIKISINLKN